VGGGLTTEAIVTPPTDRQREVLAAIRDYWRTHGNGPGIRDLMTALGFRSPNGVVCHLRPLLQKSGWRKMQAEGQSL
jgi:SOS-response transcriptional repressor LexA